MARKARADEDVLDAVEPEDSDAVEPEDSDDVDVDPDEGVLDADAFEDDGEPVDPTVLVEDGDGDGEDDVVALPLAGFDEDAEDGPAIVADDDDDDDELEGLREGEFVCRSCFMAKRESALADQKRLLCRDCA